MVDDQNVHREKHRTHQDQKIPLGDAEPILHAQEIKARHGHRHAEPNDFGYFFTNKESQQWDNHDVQSGDEPGLPRRCHADAHLLKTAGDAQKHAAAGAADEGIAVDLLFLRRGGALGGRLGLVKKHDHRQQHDAADEGPDAVVGKGSHMIHPRALGHKGCPPDERRQEQHEIALHFLSHGVVPRFSLFVRILRLPPGFFRKKSHGRHNFKIIISDSPALDKGRPRGVFYP